MHNNLALIEKWEARFLVVLPTTVSLPRQSHPESQLVDYPSSGNLLWVTWFGCT
jgi:hypothetical protein